MYRAKRCLRSVITVTICASPAALPLTADAQIWGYAEYQVRHESREEGVSADSQAATVRLDGATYLWEPYIAQVSGGIGFTVRDVEQTDGDQSATDVTGDGRLVLFPRSFFPFTAFAERRSSAVDGSLIGPDYTYSSYGFRQVYAPPQGARLALDVRHAERSDEQSGGRPFRSDSSSDFVSLAVSRAYREHSFDFRADVNQIELAPQQEVETRRFAMLRHGYAPDPTLAMQNMASYSSDRFENNRPTLTQWNSQFSSSTFWRPRTERPTLVTVSALVTEYGLESEGEVAKPQFVSFDVGGTYQSTPALTYRASSSAYEQRAISTETHVTQNRVGAVYAPAAIPIGQSFYRWSVGTDVGYRTDTSAVDSRQQAVSFSQGLNRSASMAGGTMSYGVSQQLAYIDDSARLPERAATHTASLDWSVQEEGVGTVLGVLASDSRIRNDTDGGFQLVNLQASRNHQLDRVSMWSGNATVQWTRLPTDPVNSDWNVLATAGLSYHHFRAFGVPQLRFSSELRYVSEEINQFVNAEATLDQQRQSWEWRNRLDYRIGRLELSGHLVVGVVDEKTSSLIFFQARRYLGTLR